MLSTQKTYNKNKEIIKKQFKLCITKNNRKRYEVDRHMIENVFERRRKMNEHLKKIKGTIDVERGYSLGTVFTTRNKQYMYDTGTGKVFECGANEYQILKSLFEQTSLPEKVEGFYLGDDRNRAYPADFTGFKVCKGNRRNIKGFATV